MTATSVHVHKGNSRIFLPLQEALRDHQGGLTQASFKLLLLPWIPARMGFCVHKEEKNRGEVSIFHSLLALLKVSPIGLQTKHSKGSSSWCRTPRLKIMMWSLNPLLLVENHSSCNYPPICGLPTHGYGSWPYSISTPPPCLIVVLSFLSLVIENISFSSSGLINSCSVSSCNFGVLMGGGGCGVFLLHHFGHSLFLMTLTCSRSRVNYPAEHLPFYSCLIVSSRFHLLFYAWSHCDVALPGWQSDLSIMQLCCN